MLGTWLTDDVCVPRTEMAALIAACERISQDVGLTIGVVGHAGDGNMHPTIVFDRTDPAAVRRRRRWRSVASWTPGGRWAAR